MLKCYSLNQIFQDNDLCLDLSYKNFKKDMYVYIFKFLRDLNRFNKLYFPFIIFCNDMDEYYEIKGDNVIYINEKIIEKVYFDFNKDALRKLYYILAKVNEKILISNRVVSIQTISTIKDNLLVEFQDNENNKMGISDISYYEKNRKKFSSDVYAKLDSLHWFIDYLANNDLRILKNKELDDIKIKYNNLEKKIKNRNRKITKEIYENENATLDDLFDLAISKNPDWLKRYPHLQTEYYIEDNVVKKRDFSGYELDEIDRLNEGEEFKEYVKSLVVRDKERLNCQDNVGKIKKKQKK